MREIDLYRSLLTKRRPAPNIKRASAVLCLLIILATFAMIWAFLLFDYYEWLSHGKANNFREIQECIETGMIGGNEDACRDLMKQRTAE